MLDSAQDIAAKLRRAQFKSMNEILPQVMTASVLGTVVLYFALRHQVADPALSIWFVLRLMISAARAAYARIGLRARFAAARERGDSVHRREEARFTLRLLKRPQQALKLAQLNWQVQKEPADARILLEAARAAGNDAAADEVRVFVRRWGWSDKRLEGWL